MPNLTIRNLPEETHRAIKTRARRHETRARRHGRSTEAEIREILKTAVLPEGRVRIGDELAALGAAFGGIEMDARRSKQPMRVAKFT